MIPGTRGRWLTVFSLVVLGVAASWSTGCGAEVAVVPDEVARIAGRSVTRADWRQNLERQAVGAAAGLDSRVLSRLLDQYLDELILLQWAEDEGWIGLAGSPQEKWGGVLAELSRVEVTKADAMRWIDAHRQQLELPERVRLLHLYREERAAAGETLAALELHGVAGWSGLDDDEEIETLAVDDLPVRFVEVVAGLDINHRGEILPSGGGFFVVWLAERLPARSLSDLEAAERARTALRREQTARRRLRVVEEGRDRYNARVWRENLPFDYRGPYVPEEIPEERPEENPGE